jgi:prepilin-type N-terminal cleavage/methylation domain-containing protein
MVKPVPNTRSRFRGMTRQDGFTLVECLVAIAVLGIAFSGIAAVGAVQAGGATRGMSMGQAAVTRSYYVTQASTLAQERLEQVKRLQYSVGPPAVDELGSGTPVGFSDESPVAGWPGFTRQVRVLAATPVANVKTITVTVTFTLPTATGTSQESVTMSTLASARP